MEFHKSQTPYPPKGESLNVFRGIFVVNEMFIKIRAIKCSLPGEGRGGSLSNFLIVEATEEPVAETEGERNSYDYDESVKHVEIAEGGLFVHIV